MSEQTRRGSRRVGLSLGLLTMTALMLGGCVMSEKYEAEKARSLNFQRLLAQEEKRSAELDGEVKRAKRELSDYEARNRELGAQVEAVRLQAAQIQEEAQTMRDASQLEKRAQEDMKRLTTVPSKVKKAAPAPKKDFSSTVDEMLKRDPPAEPKAESAEDLLGREKSPLEGFGSDNGAMETAKATHTVRPGETLYRIGMQYKVSVDNLRKWNGLSRDTLNVGQKLIVGR